MDSSLKRVSFIAGLLFAATALADGSLNGIKLNSDDSEKGNGKAMADEFDDVDGVWRLAFSDACVGDWRDNWTLDGVKASASNGPDGLTLSGGPDAADNGQSAVLWTKRPFSGDLKIEYEYTRLDSETKRVNILYIQAAGSGKGPYVKDISRWAGLRTSPSMPVYFNNMNLYHISYAAFENSNQDPREDYIRARRYMPLAGKGLDGTALKPDYSRTGLFETGVAHKIEVVKKGLRISMRVRAPGKELLCRFDASALPPVEEGFVGLRHMSARSARYKDFRVFELEGSSASGVQATERNN